MDDDFNFKNMFRRLFLYFFLLFYGCASDEGKEVPEFNTDSVIKEREKVQLDSMVVVNSQTLTSVIDSLKYDVQIRSAVINTLLLVKTDTIGFRYFWNSVSSNLKDGNYNGLRDVFTYPIHLLHLVTLNFSIDCDTAKYQEDETKYGNVDVTSKNYESLVNNKLMSNFYFLLNKLSCEKIVKMGYKYSDEEGFFFRLQAKDYVDVNCPNDHNLKFHFFKKGNIWKMEVDGV